MILAYLQDVGGWLEKAFPDGKGLLLSLVVLGGGVLWNLALNYSRFGTMRKQIEDLESRMITKEGLALELSNLERKLSAWADARFLGPKDLDTIRLTASFQQGQITTLQAAVDSFRERRADRPGVVGAD